MKSDIPADQLEPAQARVDQLLEALRRETQRLALDAESALTFHADRPVAFQVDGEYVGEREHVMLRSIPNALRVLV